MKLLRFLFQPRAKLYAVCLLSSVLFLTAAPVLPTPTTGAVTQALPAGATQYDLISQGFNLPSAFTLRFKSGSVFQFDAGATFAGSSSAFLAAIGATATYVPQTTTVNGHALSANVTITKSDVGLAAVENTALSTWPGTANLTTLGTITAGTWHATALGAAYGGFGADVSGQSGVPLFATGVATFAGTSGTGNFARVTSPTFVTPALGAATATTLNALTLTAASTGFTVAGGTASKTLTVGNTLALAGTDGTTMTFPSTSATVARTDAANTFTGTQTIATIGGAATTVVGNITVSGTGTNSVAGILGIGAPASYASAAIGDLVLPNASALRSSNAAGTNTFQLLRLNSSNIIQIDPQSLGVSVLNALTMQGASTTYASTGTGISMHGGSSIAAASGVITLTPAGGSPSVQIASAGPLVVNSSTASTSTTTGAIQVTGGAGIQGSVFVGGQVQTPATNTQTGFGAGIAPDSNFKFNALSSTANTGIQLRSTATGGYSQLNLQNDGSEYFNIFLVGSTYSSGDIASRTVGMDASGRPINILNGATSLTQWTSGIISSGTLAVKYTTEAATSGAGGLTTAGGIYAAKKIVGNTDIIAGGVIQHHAYIASGLPAAASYPGGICYVTDATATTRLSIVAGTGSNHVMVFSDGTNWLIL